MFAANLDNFGVFNFSSSAPTTTGNALSDFVTGQVSSMEQDTPYHTLMSAWHTAVFLQDNYRITPRLTANLGVRWDIDTPPVESSNLTAAFVPGQQSTVVPSAPLGMLFPGDKGVARGIVTTKFHHVAPRIGFAWDPFGDGKTAVRAGAGVFYGTTSGNEWNQPGNAQPFAIRQTFNSIASLSNPYGNPASFPNGDPFPYIYNREESALPCPGQHRVHRDECAMAVYLPVQFGGREAIAGTVEPDNSLRGHSSRTICPP